LQSGFGVDRKARLSQEQVLRNLPPHQFQVICQITKPGEQHYPRNYVEGAIGDNFHERIVEQDAVAREPASNSNIKTFRNTVEQISNFREEMLKITV
jgi:hypothetical protein